MPMLYQIEWVEKWGGGGIGRGKNSTPQFSPTLKSGEQCLVAEVVLLFIH